MNTQPGSGDRACVFGSDEQELARLDRQAASIAPATRLPAAAGLAVPGLRVLDLGTGLGHVARLAGRAGRSARRGVGVDRSVQALAVARQRVEAAGERHVSFVEGDVGLLACRRPVRCRGRSTPTLPSGRPLGRRSPSRSGSTPGGLFVAIDFDIGATRAKPPVRLVGDVAGWLGGGVAAGTSPMIRARASGRCSNRPGSTALRPSASRLICRHVIPPGRRCSRASSAALPT